MKGNFFVSKTTQNNVSKIAATENDIHLILTDELNMYVNKKDGNLLKITDVQFVPSYSDFLSLAKIEGKLYIVADPLGMYMYNKTTNSVTDILGIIKDSISTNTNDIDNINKSITDLSNLLTSSIENLLNTLTEYEKADANDKSEINSNIDNLNNEYTNISNNLLSITQNLGTLGSTVNTITSAISTIANTDKTQDDKITSLTNSLIDATKSIGDISKRATSLETNLNNLDQTVADINGKIETINQTLTDNKKTLDFIGSDYVTKLNFGVLNDDVDLIKSTIDTMKTDSLTKYFNSMVQIEKVEDGLVYPEIDTGIFFFETGVDVNQSLFINDITVTTKVKPTQNIGIVVKYRPYTTSDGDLGDEQILFDSGIVASNNTYKTHFGPYIGGVNSGSLVGNDGGLVYFELKNSYKIVGGLSIKVEFKRVTSNIVIPS